MSEDMSITIQPVVGSKLFMKVDGNFKELRVLEDVGAISSTKETDKVIQWGKDETAYRTKAPEHEPVTIKFAYDLSNVLQRKLEALGRSADVSGRKPEEFKLTDSSWEKPEVKIVTFSNTANAVNLPAHAFEEGLEVKFSNPDDNLPSGITAGMTYLVSSTGKTSNLFKLEKEDGTAVAFTTDGTGTTSLHYLSPKITNTVFKAWITRASVERPADASHSTLEIDLRVNGSFTVTDETPA